MKELLGIFSVLIVCVAYFPYIRDTLLGRTRPHAVSWLVWGVLAAIAFGVQVTNGGGPGAWLMAVNTVLIALIFGLSLWRGEKHVMRADWFSLAFSVVAIALWVVVNQPLLCVILISLTDAIGGFLPTFRKSMRNPFQETASMYALFGLSLVWSLMALTDFTVVNALYPASFMAINIIMALYLINRRRSIYVHSYRGAEVLARE